MTERIRELAAASLAHDLLDPPVPVEHDPRDLALPTAVFNARRAVEYILAQPVYLRKGSRFSGMFRFAGCEVPGDLFSRHGHPVFKEIMKHYYKKPQDNLVVFEWQHSTPDYEFVLKNGIEGVLSEIAFRKEKYKFEKEKYEFLEAEEIVCRGVIGYAEKCSDAYRGAADASADPAERAVYLGVADALSRVPRRPATSFYEALQSLLFCFFYLPDSVGTIDRYLYPYYVHDIDAGLLSREQAGELIAEFYVHLSNFTPAGSTNADRSAECHFAIGGYTEEGEDGFNDLSRLLAETLLQIDTRRPAISLRWTRKTPFEVLRFMLDCERHDKNKRFAFVNDEPRIKGLMNICGLSRSEAIRYTMVGCNEPALPGMLWLGGCTVNIARSLTNVLYDRTAEAVACRTFDEFFALFRDELSREFDLCLEWENLFNDMRARDLNVVSSFLLDGPIENGISGSQGGCRLKIGGMNLMGYVSVIDSLSIVKQFVFEEKRVSMAQLIETLKNDWGDGALRTEILNRGRFFGNADPLSDGIARRFTGAIYDLTHDRITKWGAHLIFGTLAGYNAHYVAFGKTTPATPDGRHAGDAFIVGSSQGGGKDRNGLIPLLSSIAQSDPHCVMTGPVVCNVRVDEKTVTDDDQFEKFCRTVETYFKLGGIHIQLNYVSSEELLAAQEAPEDHRSLKVRVSGFSTNFVKLSEGVQNEIIARTIKQ